MALNRNYVSHYIRHRDLHGLWGPRASRLKWKRVLIRLKQLFLQFHYFLKARVSPSKHHVSVSTGSIRAYKFKFWWFLWLNKKWYKNLVKIYPNIHQGIMDPNIFNIRILSSVFKWHLLKRICLNIQVKQKIKYDFKKSDMALKRI